MLGGSDLDKMIEEIVQKTLNSDLATPLNMKITQIGKGQKRLKIFDSNDTFLVPEGVTEIYLSACAAGGGGGGGNREGAVSGGLAGAEVVRKPIAVVPGESIEITVGTGNTVFGKYLTLLAASYRGPVQLDGSNSSSEVWTAYGGSSGAFGYGGYASAGRYAEKGGDAHGFGAAGGAANGSRYPGGGKGSPGIVIIEW